MTELREATTGASYRHREHLRTVVEWTILVLVALAPLLRYPNVIIPDTHIGLAVAPEKLLEVLNSTWNDRGSLGYDYTRSQTLLFPVGAFFSLIPRLGIGPGYATQAWIAVCLLVAGASMRFFIRTWLGGTARFPALLGAVAFMASPFVITFITDTSLFFLGYALLPAQIALVIRIQRAETPGPRGTALLALTFLLVSAIDIPLLLINAGVVSLFGLGYWFAKHRSRLGLTRLVFVGVGLTVGALLLAWSLLPMAASYFTDPTAAQANLDVETAQLYNRETSYSEVLRLQGYWALYSGYAGRPYRPYQAYYLETWIGIGGGYLLLLLATAGLANSRRDPVRILLGATLVLSVPLVVGVHPPEAPSGSGQLMGWIFQAVPLATIFRNTFKFASVLNFAVIALAAGTFQSVLQSRRLPAVVKMGGRFGVFALVGIVTMPFFVGRLWWSDKLIERAPSDWFRLADWLNAQPPGGRVLYLPNMPAPVYLWGLPVSELGEVLIDRPQSYLMPGVQSYAGDEFLSRLYEDLEEPASNIGEGTSRMLSKSRIEFLVVRHDARFGYYPGTAAPYELSRKLQGEDGISFVRAFGKLDLYRVEFHSAPHVSVYPLRSETPGEFVPSPVSLGESRLRSIQPSNGDRPLDVHRVDSSRYEVWLRPSASWQLIVLREAFHGGWIASVDGETSVPPRHLLADGYANGWLLPPGIERVTLIHSPARFVGPARLLSGFGLAIVALLLASDPLTKGARTIRRYVAVRARRRTSRYRGIRILGLSRARRRDSQGLLTDGPTKAR